MRLRLNQTSVANPEMYDVVDQSQVGKVVAQLHLWGRGQFTVCVPDASGRLILSMATEGGTFQDEIERKVHLAAALAAIEEYYHLTHYAPKPQGGTS